MIRFLHKPIFIISLLLVCVCSLASPYEGKSNAVTNNSVNVSRVEADKLWAILRQVSDRLKLRMQVDDNKTLISKILTQSCEAPSPNSFLVKALKAEAKNKKSNNGLSVRGAYTSKSLSDNDGDSSAYLELSWDVLRQGYKENNRQAEALYRQAKIETLKGDMQRFDETYRCRRYQLNETFIGLQSNLVSLKLELMEPVYKVEKRAYFKGWSYLDELLVSEQDIRLAQQELKYLNTEPRYNEKLSESINPAVIDVDLQAVIKNIKQDERVAKLQALEKQSVSDRYQYRRNDKLRLFLRKEFDVGGNGSDNGVVAGLRFTIPIEKKNKQSLVFRLENLEEDVRLKNWQRIARTRAAYEELREQKTRVVKQQYRYLRSKERVRRVLVRKGLNEELELAAAVARVRSMFDAAIELVKAKEELYRRVNEVFLVSRVGYTPSLIKIDALQENNYRARSGERSIYIWSKTFNSTNNKTILDLLNAKSIKHVLLSVSKKIDRQKMADFVKQAELSEITIEAIVGSNNWFKPEQHGIASLVSMTRLELTGRIHLDIEPHTVDGYKRNKETYLNNYVSMLQRIRKEIGNGKLSVSVPTHWPAGVYEKINQLVDKVYFMAYENKTTDVMIRRVKKVLANVDVNKAVVVLSVKDFDDEWDMEKVIHRLEQETGVEQFGFHQLRTYMKKVGAKL